MRHTNISISGRTIAMPSVSLGTVWFGTKMDKKVGRSQLDYYLEMGGTWLDTARVYGLEIFNPENTLPHYEDSEAVVGQWLRDSGARDHVTLITKGGHRRTTLGNKSNLHESVIRQDIERSLRTLGVDFVDIYFLHSDDENIPVAEVMPVLHELVQSGKTRTLGASNWSAERIIEANAFAVANGLTPFGITQVRWSYAIPPESSINGRRDIETDASQYKIYRGLNFPIMAYSSQSKGFFIKTASNGFSPESLGRAVEFLSEENIARAKTIHRLAAEEGVAASAMAFAYLWGKETPVTAMVGCQCLEDLKVSLTDCDYIPSERVIAALEASQHTNKY